MGANVNKDWFLTSLILAGFTASSPVMLTGLLLIDIGASFGVSVGVAGQIRTFSSVIAIFSALFLGALSIRYRYKRLLMMGIFFIFLSSVGCSLSFNFNMMLLSYSISGLGLSVILPMAFSLIGENLLEEERSKAIGYVIAGQASSYVVGLPIINYISDNWGWRASFLGYIIPVALLSFILVLRTVPLDPKKDSDEGIGVLTGFREVFINRSAVACLIGFVFSVFAFQAVVTYSASFFRENFLLSKSLTSVYLSGLAIMFVSGSVLGGRYVNRFGRKRLTVLATLIGGVFTITFTNVPLLSFSLGLVTLAAFFNGVRYSSASSLTLEQVPKFRGTIMSLFSASDNLGAAFGAGIGGYILIFFDYNLLGVVLGLMGIISTIIFYLLTRDP